MLSRLVARAPRLAVGVVPRCLRPLAAPLLLPLPSLASRSIITVDVYQPTDRTTPGDHSSRMAMLAEVSRAEEIALARYNRLVNEDVARGCLRPGARRNKRWARHTKRGLRMRHNRMATKWRAHKRKLSKLMNWVSPAPTPRTCRPCRRSRPHLRSRCPVRRFNIGRGGAWQGEMVARLRHGFCAPNRPAVRRAVGRK